MQQQINVILPVVGAEYVCCVILKKNAIEMWAELIGLPEHFATRDFSRVSCKETEMRLAAKRSFIERRPRRCTPGSGRRCLLARRQNPAAALAAACLTESV
jgi:hypothetical protein